MVTSVVTTPLDRVALLDAAEVLLGAALLLGVARGRDAEAAEAAVGGVELGARAGDRHPHRRVRLLHRLRQHVAFGHRERSARRTTTCSSAHSFGQHAHELVPRLLGVVGVDVEAAELGPRGAARGADLEPTAREDVERRAALGDADRVVHLGHAHDRAVADADALGLRRDRGEHHLGRRAVRVLLEEVVLDRPHPVEAELVGEAGLLERVAVAPALSTSAVNGRGVDISKKIPNFTPAILKRAGVPLRLRSGR